MATGKLASAINLPLPPMITHLYRFRPADAILGRYNELSKQEIYFAAPEKLNDPMEGYKDVFWSGDLILWRNLIRHYLVCLIQMTYLYYVMGPDFDSANLKVLVIYRAIIRTLCALPRWSGKRPAFPDAR
jgi:hypothetical protein